MITVAPPPTRDYLSYSAVRAFQGCPLKYRFRYIDGLPEDCVSSSLVFGSAIHAAVEFFFSQQLAGEEEPSLDELLDVYQQSWRDRSEQEVRFGKTETADSLHQLADRMLTAFLASDLTKQEGRIIGVEEELRGELSPELPDLLGRVDLLLETDDSVIVQDFKTSRSAWNDYQAEDQSEQLLLYGELARRLVPGKQVRLQFAVITKAKTPKVQLLEASFDESKLDRTKRVFENVWSAIQSGHFYPSPSPMQCPGCGYRNQCAAWLG
ncbi:MAG: PD-(D/E)XK nuclease family protein [Planctomycetota bacterium]|nr:PD-(D/E)XK nuclease family protein [Planctomycetota bacterium]